MSNKMKSLSDSSTSESEDDVGKRSNTISWSAHKRSHSSDSAQEDQHVNSFYSESRTTSNFKRPMTYTDRYLSTDDTEDEHSETAETPSKKIKPELGHEYIERQLLADHTDSESDDKSVPEFSEKTIANMPSIETINGSIYGRGLSLMQKMGYKEGTGLGKYSQGRVNIIEASKQRGRRGLGLQIKGLEPNSELWDFSEDPISLSEDISWIPECDTSPVSMKTFREWMREGEKKMTIDDETEFCDPEILEKVIAYKTVFDNLEGDELRKARSKSNPFETIRGGMFLNRAAMKMANMDSAFDFMFTQPKDEQGESAVGPHELLYFADVCAGPGGFSEYVLWRKRWESKGFGFTLKGGNDFKLSDFFSGPPETFEPYYGKKGDGDVYDPENIKSLRDFVLANTEQKGVHFMMADGGFSVEGKENLQEVLSKRLYLCQFLCALKILRSGGHFVCKLFDIFTPFSVGLIYLMYMAFKKVCIFKPNTSRPANSERYIICKFLRDDVKDIGDYMYEVNCNLDSYSNDSEMDIEEIVPLHILKRNKDFYEYIVESNNVIGARQIIYLDKVRAFAQNGSLIEDRQNDLRTQSLKLWNVPDKLRAAPTRCDANDRFKQLLQGDNLNLFNAKPTFLTVSNLKLLEHVFDFHCVVCGTNSPSLFIGTGKSNVFSYDGKGWCKIESTLELPADTVFYGELVYELKGESKGQRKIQCLHIIDVLFLGGKDVRNHHYEERMIMAKKLAKAVAKPSIPSYMLLRVKRVWTMQNIGDIFQLLSMKLNKGSPVQTLCYNLEDARHIIPGSLLIYKTTLDPWMTAFSKSAQKIYLFNTKKNISSYEKIEDAIANFKKCFETRLQWLWDKDIQLIREQERLCTGSSNGSLLHGYIVKKFIQGQLQKMTGKSF